MKYFCTHCNKEVNSVPGVDSAFNNCDLCELCLRKVVLGFDKVTEELSDFVSKYLDDSIRLSNENLIPNSCSTINTCHTCFYFDIGYLSKYPCNKCNKKTCYYRNKE